MHELKDVFMQQTGMRLKALCTGQLQQSMIQQDHIRDDINMISVLDDMKTIEEDELTRSQEILGILETEGISISDAARQSIQELYLSRSINIQARFVQIQNRIMRHQDGLKSLSAHCISLLENSRQVKILEDFEKLHDHFDFLQKSSQHMSILQAKCSHSAEQAKDFTGLRKQKGILDIQNIGSWIKHMQRILQIQDHDENMLKRFATCYQNACKKIYALFDFIPRFETDSGTESSSHT